MVMDLSLTANEYQQLALRTFNGTHYGSQSGIINGIMGLCGESGECIDILKKHLFQGHDLDKEHLKEELGDVAWYLAVSSHCLGFDLETVLQDNIRKLKKRYPDGFAADRSVNRE